MKKFLLLASVMLTLLFSSCVEEHYYPESLRGHWVLMSEEKADTPATDAPKSPLALTFYSDILTVDNATYSQRPFSSSSEWVYYVDKDDFLVITRYYYDSDGTETDTYHLRYSLSEDESELSISYKPLLGSNKYYTFLRR